MNTTHLIGAEQVERAGRNMAVAADTIERAASFIDRSADHLARTIDEAVTRFTGNLAEHDAERPTLRDHFAAHLPDEPQAHEGDYSDQFKAALVGRECPSLRTDGPLAVMEFEAEFRARWRYMRADAMVKARQL